MALEEFRTRLENDSELGLIVRASRKRLKLRWFLAPMLIPLLALFTLEWMPERSLESEVLHARAFGGGAGLMEKIGPEHRLYEAMIAVVGASGRSESAAEWMRPGLSHKRASVRRAALVWYPWVGSETDPEYQEAVRSTGGR